MSSAEVSNLLITAVQRCPRGPSVAVKLEGHALEIMRRAVVAVTRAVWWLRSSVCRVRKAEKGFVHKKGAFKDPFVSLPWLISYQGNGRTSAHELKLINGVKPSLVLDQRHHDQLY